MNPQSNNTKLLSIAEASRVLGVSEATISRWIKAGTIPHYRIGNRTRINVADLLNSARVEPETQPEA